MKLERLSDEELLTRAKAALGSPPALDLLDELFRRHYAQVARWCFRFSGDRESAADLAQEIFAKVHRSLGSFQGHSKFSTWLYAIARNECLNAVRARAVGPGAVGGEMLVALPEQNGGDWVAAERVSCAELARELLNESLDDLEKKVFTLHFGEDLPLEAITRLLGLRNASGAKAFIVSARRKLRRSIQRWKAREQRAIGARER